MCGVVTQVLFTVCGGVVTQVLFTVCGGVVTQVLFTVCVWSSDSSVVYCVCVVE